MAKILAVSDQIVERIFSLAANGHFSDIDFVLGCGDLPYSYLEYLVSILNIPLLYVPGNHDPVYNPQNENSYAEGCSNLDLKTGTNNNLLIAGFGGSLRYRPDGVNQYTQNQAISRAYRLLPTLFVNRLKHGRALDILITHSPPYGIHDEQDEITHQGLKAINLLIRRGKPRYVFHGHTHFYRQNLAASTTQVGPTTIMNIFPYKVIEINHE
jgi:Icc-related predicted phosphoesterase